jgi:hypothetical protein
MTSEDAITKEKEPIICPATRRRKITKIAQQQSRQ